MSELRYYGFKMEVENASGIKKIKEFRLAVSNVDDTVDMLNSTLGDNITVTARKIQGDKEALAQARLLNRQNERQLKKTQQVTDQYRLLNRTIEEYGNDLETVNAITRLGSNATDEQRREVAALVQQYQQLRNTGDAARGSMRNLRGAAQNFGWQLQDTVVQLQMNTDAMIVMTQQGSQMLSAFGMWGALAGAAVAVIGAVLPSVISYFTDAASSADELRDAQQRLNSVLDSTGITVNGVTKEIQELYRVNSSLAELQLFRALNDAQAVLSNYRKEIKDSVGDMVGDLARGYQRMNDLTIGTAEYNRGARIMSSRLKEVSEELGVNKTQAKSLALAYQEFLDTGENDSLTRELSNLSKSSNELTPEFRELVSTYIDLTSKGELAEAQLKELRAIMNGSKSVTDSYNQTIETTAEKYQRMREQLSLNDAQLAVDNFLREEGLNLSKEEQSATAIQIAQYYNAKRATDERIKAEQELIKLRDGLSTGTMTELDKEELRHKQNIALIEKARQEEYDVTVNYDQLIEQETNRHALAQKQAQLTMAQGWMSTVSGLASFVNDIGQEYYNGAEQVRNATEDMDKTQKHLYFMMRAVKAAEAFVNGWSLGMKLAELTLNPAMVTVGASLGAASAGTIMGTTFAGMYDEGGYIPSGKKGIVSEYGDELVNGVMVKGPARVTSREETAKMMSQGGSTTLNLTIENRAQGVNHRVEQIGPDDFRVIAEQVFRENIDAGVANSVSRKGSKSDKAMRSNYAISRSY